MLKSPLIDVQRLRVLTKMYELRSVKAVAIALQRSPGMVSKTISKLKEQLADPLFVPTKNGFEPSLYVEQNIRHVYQILESYEKIQISQFDPELTDETFLIYAPALFWEHFGSRLYALLKQAAPNAKFSFRMWGAEARDAILRGEGHVGIHIYEEDVPQSLYQEKIGSEQIVVYARHDHPASSIEELQDYPLAITRTSGWNDQRYQVVERLQAMGLDIDVSVESEYSGVCEELVMQGDHFAMKLGRGIGPQHKVFPLKGVDLQFDYVVSCRRSRKDSPAMQWFTGIIKQMLS